jgi:hypothetical protein
MKASLRIAGNDPEIRIRTSRIQLQILTAVAVVKGKGKVVPVLN